MQKSTLISDHHTKSTFLALIDALIPSSSEPKRAASGTDVQVDEYLIWSLDHYTDITMINRYGPLSRVTAELLDAAASLGITAGTVKEPRDTKATSDGCTFASLSPKDRLRTLSFLEETSSSLSILPGPFKGNPELVRVIVGLLNRLPAFGFYSEWTGYASTRLTSPEEREQTSKPAGWEQAGYPGPIEAGRDFRGFLVETFSE